MKTLIFAPSLLAIALIATPASAGLGGGFMGGARGGGGDWFETADKNRDGIVTRAEFLAYRDGNFDRLDRNGDGVVSPADFPRLAQARPAAYQRLTEALGNADANHDGAISRAEMAKAPPAMFDRADANHDGKVTKAEFDAAREQMRSRVEQMRR